jgi:hypothetical protein
MLAPHRHRVALADTMGGFFTREPPMPDFRSDTVTQPTPAMREAMFKPRRWATMCLPTTPR